VGGFATDASCATNSGGTRVRAAAEKGFARRAAVRQTGLTTGGREPMARAPLRLYRSIHMRVRSHARARTHARTRTHAQTGILHTDTPTSSYMRTKTHARCAGALKGRAHAHISARSVAEDLLARHPRAVRTRGRACRKRPVLVQMWQRCAPVPAQMWRDGTGKETRSRCRCGAHARARGGPPSSARGRWRRSLGRSGGRAADGSPRPCRIAMACYCYMLARPRWCALYVVRWHTHAAHSTLVPPCCECTPC
jgi:hypothetical protein